MTDRLLDLVVGLQRMAENARIRGDDIKYSQQQEDAEHARWLDQLLAMVQRVHSTLIDERRRFATAEQEPLPGGSKPPQLNPNRIQEVDAPPKFIQKGPRT
jgi:hypothetical protein